MGVEHDCECVISQDVIDGFLDHSSALQLTNLVEGDTFRLRRLMVRGPQTRTPPQWKCGQVCAGLLGLRARGWPPEPGLGGGRGLPLGLLQVAVEPSVGGQAHLWLSHMSSTPNRTSLWTLRENWA